MATQDPIDYCKKLFSDRAGTRGISSNVSPDRFNRWFHNAELRFFNEMYDQYAKRQTISDSISKWFTDPLYLPIPSTGVFPFFPGMNLLHVDSMSNYLVTTGTQIATLGTLTPGTGYTPGNYTVALTGGTGTGATAYIVVNAAGNVQTVLPSQQGSGYAVNDSLSAALPVGTGFSILVASLTGATDDNPVTRVEKQLVAANLSSSYDAPTQQFPIYTQYSTSFAFYPKNIGFVKTVYLQQPVWSYWGYLLQGYIATLTGLVGGSLYTNGTYQNVPLTGGLGNGALATIVVSGNAVTRVTLTNPGKIYGVNDVLSASNANIGGTGSGFTITVSSLVQGSIRPVYNPATSIQPLWNNDDLSTIIDLALSDAAVSARDKELTNFAQTSQQSQQ